MKEISLKHAVMQSFTSIGPMLDFIALFSVIAVYSGILLPLVIIFSFLLSYFTLYSIYGLSKIFITNGGYYSYVGNLLGKDAGIFIFLLFLGYSLLTVPNIADFISAFLSSILNLSGVTKTIAQYLIIILFIGLVYLTVAGGLKISIKYTLIAGLLEIIFILFLSTIFFIYRNPDFSISMIKFKFNPFFFGIIFGILAFSGGGSSIFLSEKTNVSPRNTPKSLLISFTISGIIMSISAFALVFFIGYKGLLNYEVNPLYIISIISDKFGYIFMIIFSLFGIFSGFNLSVSYLNAFMNMIPRFHSDFNFGYKLNIRKLMVLLFILSLAISISSTYLIGAFTAFVIIAGVISFLYIIIHIFANISLIKYHMGRKFLVPALSSLFLSIAFIFSFISNSGYFVVINYILASYVIISIILVVYIKTLKNKFYSKIRFDHGIDKSTGS